MVLLGGVMIRWSLVDDGLCMESNDGGHALDLTTDSCIMFRGMGSFPTVDDRLCMMDTR